LLALPDRTSILALLPALGRHPGHVLFKEAPQQWLAGAKGQAPVIEKGAFSTRTRSRQRQRDPPQHSRSGS
jgi:hypothetical protein